MKLSILICTLKNRQDYAKRLRECLYPQVENVSDQVEVLWAEDEGQQSIGHKRNELLKRAKGDYIAFVDDDDLLSDDYVARILSALESEPDCVGMHLLHFNDGVLGGLTYHSLRYTSWHESRETTLGMMRYYRNPNHLNPVKRDLALQVMFPEISMGEDKDYSTRLLPLLKTEEYIVEPIYYYLFRRNK